MNSRFRCSTCKAYFRMEEAYSSNGLQRFCSSSCAGKSSFNDRSDAKALVRTGGPKPTKQGVTPKRRGTRGRPPADEIPTAVRADVLARDHHQCRRCGFRKVQLHHINYRSSGVDHQPHNLIALCAECHATIHSDKRHWQPICRAYVWLRDVQGRVMTLKVVEELVSAPCEDCWGSGYERDTYRAAEWDANDPSCATDTTPCRTCRGRGSTP